MGGNLIVRPMGPIFQAINQARQAIYQRPQEYIQGIDETLFPNPLQPVRPMGPPKAEPLGWQFDWGRNLIFTPREDAQYSADDLRRLATYPLARICIENNKDVLTRMPWKVQLRAKPGETAKERAARAKNDPKLLKITRFMEKPNPEKDWEDFWRPILDDMLVIDAASIFVAKNRTGDVVQLRWVEGSSITRLVDEHGWTPQPPNPAYQQLWYGYPRVDLTTEQLVYKPRNIVPRNTQSSYLYGMSPTEQVAEEIKIGQARLNFIYDFYREGSIPGGILFAPVNTPPDKIKEAQQWLDSDLAGQLAKRRRLQILQGFQGDGKSEQLHFPKEPVLADMFDELHTRKICFAYGVSPNRLMKLMNRASSEQNQEAAMEEGTLPYLNWFKSVADYIIQEVLGEDEYEVSFDPFHETDKLKQAMADAEDIKVGLYTRNEKREERGDDPRDEPEADELNVMTAQGLVPLDYVPPPVPGGTSGSSSSGGQRKTTTQIRTGASRGEAAASGGTGVGKAEGNGHFRGCAAHAGTYPRSFCTECVRAEALWSSGVR